MKSHISFGRKAYLLECFLDIAMVCFVFYLFLLFNFPAVVVVVFTNLKQLIQSLYYITKSICFTFVRSNPP